MMGLVYVEQVLDFVTLTGFIFLDFVTLMDLYSK